LFIQSNLTNLSLTPPRNTRRISPKVD